jgi:hypothetical protein
MNNYDVSEEYQKGYDAMVALILEGVSVETARIMRAAREAVKDHRLAFNRGGTQAIEDFITLDGKLPGARS